MIMGKTIEEAMLLTRKDLVEAVGGLPSRKQHAAALAIETLELRLIKKQRGQARLPDLRDSQVAAIDLSLKAIQAGI